MFDKDRKERLIGKKDYIENLIYHFECQQMTNHKFIPVSYILDCLSCDLSSVESDLKEIGGWNKWYKQ